LWPYSRPAPTDLRLSCAEGSRAGRRTPGRVSPEQRGRVTSLDLLAMILWMQTRIQLAFWAAHSAFHP